MIDQITEGSVMQAARDWAARRNKDNATALANASATMAVFKKKLSKADYDRALANLYREYQKS